MWAEEDDAVPVERVDRLILPRPLDEISNLIEPGDDKQENSNANVAGSTWLDRDPPPYPPT